MINRYSTKSHTHTLIAFLFTTFNLISIHVLVDINVLFINFLALPRLFSSVIVHNYSFFSTLSLSTSFYFNKKPHSLGSPISFSFSLSRSLSHPLCMCVCLPVSLSLSLCLSPPSLSLSLSLYIYIYIYLSLCERVWRMREALCVGVLVGRVCVQVWVYVSMCECSRIQFTTAVPEPWTY